MTSRFLAWLKNRGSWRMIRRDGADYLERFLLWRYKKGSTYLHRFWQDDPDDLHDHPWRSISIILKGGYREWFLDGTYIDRKAGGIILRDAASMHRIELLEGTEPGSCWSLFITFGRVRDWGFLTPDGWVKASEYSREPAKVYGKDFVYEGHLFPKVVNLKGDDNAE